MSKRTLLSVVLCKACTIVVNGTVIVQPLKPAMLALARVSYEQKAQIIAKTLQSHIPVLLSTADRAGNFEFRQLDNSKA